MATRGGVEATRTAAGSGTPYTSLKSGGIGGPGIANVGSYEGTRTTSWSLRRRRDPGGRELSAARERALRAGLASFAEDRSPVADAVRQEFTAHLTYERADSDAGDATGSAHSEIHRRALQAARQAVLAMRANDEIGDDAFHRMEKELDWLEMTGVRKGE